MFHHLILLFWSLQSFQVNAIFSFSNPTHCQCSVPKKQTQIKKHILSLIISWSYSKWKDCTLFCSRIWCSKNFFTKVCFGSIIESWAYISTLDFIAISKQTVQLSIPFALIFQSLQVNITFSSSRVPSAKFSHHFLTMQQVTGIHSI